MLNVNDNVIVKLLPEGERILRALLAGESGDYWGACIKPYKWPKYYEGQLHVFMNAFGAHMDGLGTPFTQFYFKNDPVVRGLRELVEGHLITTSRAAEIMGISVADFRFRAYPYRVGDVTKPPDPAPPTEEES